MSFVFRYLQMFIWSKERIFLYFTFFNSFERFAIRAKKVIEKWKQKATRLQQRVCCVYLLLLLLIITVNGNDILLNIPTNFVIHSTQTLSVSHRKFPVLSVPYNIRCVNLKTVALELKHKMDALKVFFFEWTFERSTQNANAQHYAF